MTQPTTAHSDRNEHDPLLASIVSRLPQLSHDELRVFDVQLDRMLRIGRANYAPLDLASDKRDWSREIGEELSDALFYLCARHVAREDAKRERRQCQRHDEAFARVAEAWRRSQDALVMFSFDCEDGVVREVLR